jgi:Ca2+-binding RTX toxin-like protein
MGETVWMGQRNQIDGLRGGWLSRRVALLAAICLCTGGLFLLAGGADSSTVAVASAAGRSSQEAAELHRDDRGLYLAFCPEDEEAANIASDRSKIVQRASVAMANHTGWPSDECLKMDKGPAGLSHTLVGLEHVHNWLLGGYGNDTIFGGDDGDVIWGDYHPEGQSESQVDRLHGGAGDDWIYSSHGYNEIWTGGGDDHLALVYGHGVVFCDGGGLKTFVMRYLPQNRPWKLVGCDHKVIDPYRA